jgi:hypothetical protein
VAGAELAKLRHDRVEVAQRLAQHHERREEHRLLVAHVGMREQRLDGRRGAEQTPVEDLGELVPARGDQVEAGFKSVDVKGHRRSLGAARVRRKCVNPPICRRGTAR